jgi:glycosyltransferase involved in cell wall biosynthesis
MRVLHVVGAMNRGGIETWLMHVLRHTDRARVQHEFMVHTANLGAYDHEIVSRGSRLHRIESTRNPAAYAAALHRHLRSHGRYDVVHSHVHHFSGLVLTAAYLAGVGTRIAHSHSDTSSVQATAGLGRRAYLRATESLIRRFATSGLAASSKAGAALFRWPESAGCAWRVLHYGVDVEPFRTRPDSDRVRRELGIPPHALVVGHVGNLLPVKNHRLLIETFAEIGRQAPAAMLLMIGTGPLKTDLEAQVAALGLTSRVIFAGARSDVPTLLMGAIDVFMFPSLWEGLPLAAVEAQAAGLPIALSDRVSEEADVVPELIRRLSPTASPQDWAQACLELTNARAVDGYTRVAESDLNIVRCVDALERVYESSRSAPHWAGAPAQTGVN